MPVTLLDGILLGITLVSAILAMVRGFSREVLSLVSWAAAAAAAYLFYQPVLPYLQPYINNETIAKIAAAGAVFLVVLIVVSLITMKIADFIIDSRIGALDRTLGFLFGLARGFLIMVVAFLFFNWLVQNEQGQPEWIRDARSKLVLQSAGDWLISILPEDPESLIREMRSSKDAEPTEPPPEPVAPGSAPATPSPVTPSAP